MQLTTRFARLGVKMQGRRRALKGFVKGSAAALAYVSGWSRLGNQASLMSTSHAAVDPVTAMVAAQTALNLVSSFASSDGGMGAMLKAQRQMLVLISEQLDDVVKALADVRVRLASMPQLVADEAERSRLAGYYETVISRSGSLKESGEAWFNSKTSASVRKQLVSDFRMIADDVRDARGALFVHPTLIAAAALPIALTTEVAARRLAGQTDLLVPALNSYEQAIKNCLDSTRSRSVSATLESTLRHHNELVAGCSRWAGSPCSFYSVPFGRLHPPDVQHVVGLGVTLPDGTKISLGRSARYRVRLPSCHALTHSPYLHAGVFRVNPLADDYLPLRVNNVHHYMWSQVIEAEQGEYKKLTLSGEPLERRVVDEDNSQCNFHVPATNAWVASRRPRADWYDRLANGPFLVTFEAHAENGRVRLGEELWKEDNAKLQEFLNEINASRLEASLYAAATKLLLDTRERIQQVRTTL